MPRLLLLLPSTTYRGQAFLNAAEILGLSTTIGSPAPSSSSSGVPPDFLNLNFKDVERAKESVLAFARQYPIDAVLGVDDVTAEIASVFASALRLPHNPPHAVTTARNKYLMRQCLGTQGIPIPRYQLFCLDDHPSILAGSVSFPCVVKPTVLSASCGVIRADDPESFIQAFIRVAGLLATIGPELVGEGVREILVEEYVPGTEVALEGLLHNGALQVLALFDKPDPLEGPYFEETLYITPSRLSANIQKDIRNCAARAVRALGLQEGPIHGEFRINDRGVWVIEVAPRSIGGQCSRTLRFGLGMSLEEIIVRHACRMDIPSMDREDQAAGVMMLPIPKRGRFQEVQGLLQARAVPGVEDVQITAELGDLLVPLPEGTRYLGFLFARGSTPECVEQSLRTAHGCLTVVLEEPQAGKDIGMDPGIRKFFRV